MKNITVIEILIIIATFIIVIGSYNCANGSELNMSIASTSDLAPGCSNDDQIYKLEGGYAWNEYISKRLSYDKELYGAMLYDGSAYPAIGFKVKLNYHFNENWFVFAGCGAIGIYNGGDMSGLSDDEWFFQTLEAGLGYKDFTLSIWHCSSYRHHAEDDDSGVNMPKITYNRRF